MAVAIGAGSRAQSRRSVRDGLPDADIRLAIDPTHPNELYAGVEVGGVVRSLDGGATGRIAMRSCCISPPRSVSPNVMAAVGPVKA